MGYSRDQVLAAAAVKPSSRTTEQNAAVASDSSNQAVRNALAESARDERINGKDK